MELTVRKHNEIKINLQMRMSEDAAEVVKAS